MKQSAEFLSKHNIPVIVEDLLIQPIDAFHTGLSRTAEPIAKVCWDSLQRYNHLLQGTETSSVEMNPSKKQLLNQELERLRSFTKSLWRCLTREAQEYLWMEWLKVGLVKITEHLPHTVIFKEVSNSNKS